VTPALRSITYGEQLQVAAANPNANNGLYTSAPLPVELRESLNDLQTKFDALAPGASLTETPYELENLADAANVTTVADAHHTGRLAARLATTSTAGSALDPIASMLIAPFQAQSYQDDFTGKIYSRERWIDPQTGQWLSPDSMRTIDSSNPYVFGGADPVNKRDPTGLYQADFHYGLTYYLARRAGFSRMQARAIAMAAESPDQDPEHDPIRTTVGAVTDAMLGMVMRGPIGHQKREEERELRARLRRDHFPRGDSDSNVVVPFSQESQRRVIEGMRTGQLATFGEGLHTLQDSESHRGLPSLFGMSGHPKERGGWTSKETDILWAYPRQAAQAAEATYNYLPAFARQRNGPSQNQPTWLDVRSEVAQFIALKERSQKKNWLLAHGVDMPEDYWDDVSMGPQEEADSKHHPLIDPQTAARIRAAQAECHCASGY
jgi:RHS repeat-associated protein